MKLSCGSVLLLVVFAIRLAFAGNDMLSVSMVHRGDGFDRPENSLEAILHCWSKGAVPEADIWKTGDGVLVAWHDACLKGRRIGEWTWAELRQEDIGSLKGKEWRGVRIPTWDSIFAAMKGCPGRKVYMDWKDGGSISDLVARIRSYGVERQVYCHAGNYQLLKDWKRALPEGRCSFWTWIGSWSRIDFNAPGAVEKGEAHMRDMFSVAENDGFAAADVLHLLIQCDFGREDPFCPTTPFLKEAVAKVHARGKLITAFPWGHDGENADAYRRIRDLGFDGWGTDCPAVMYSVAEE